MNTKSNTTPDQIIKEIINDNDFYQHRSPEEGGPVKYGINMAMLQAHTGLAQNEHNIRVLNKEMAHIVYSTDYFLRPHIDQLPTAMQPLMLWFAIKTDVQTAIALLQNILMAYRTNNDTLQPGKIGSDTRAAVHVFLDLYDMKTLITLLTNNAVIHFERIVKQDETQRGNLAHWINRLDRFCNEINQ